MVHKDRMRVVVAGKSGDGATRTVSEVLTPVLTGLNIFAQQTYVDILSVIKSPDIVSTTFPIGPEAWASSGDNECDLLIALDDDSYKPNPAHKRNPIWDTKPNRASIVKFGECIVPGGCIIYDSSKNVVAVETFVRNLHGRQINAFPIPAAAIAREIGFAPAKNILMVGALFAFMDCPEGLELLCTTLDKKFGKKNPEAAEKNIQAARRGYEELSRLKESARFPLQYKIVPPPPEKRLKYLAVTGNEATVLGALAAGCRAMTGYPISPATPELTFMGKEIEKYGGGCYQVSDELAAVHALIGLAATGVRAFTATSGPGYSLMIEGIGHAATMEVGIVIVNCQRKGPDTGAPTKPEQADLNLAIAGSHGDIQKIVLAPANQEDCFWIATEAFNLADIYQCPVIILLDQTLAEGKGLVPVPDLSRVVIDRGKLVKGEIPNPESFKRYALSEDGVSSRALLGIPNVISRYNGTEHTEAGQVTATPEGIVVMNDKRERKMTTYLKNHFAGPRIHGDIRNADIVLVSWGSTESIVLDAASRLKETGVNASVVHFTHVWPLDRATLRALFPKETPIAALEANMSGQFANVLEGIIHRDTYRINDYSGRPFEPSAIVESVLDILMEQNKTAKGSAA